MSSTLTVEERACLLRAARAHILKLRDEYHRFEEMAGSGHADAQAPMHSAVTELACTQRAVSKLWQEQMAAS